MKRKISYFFGNLFGKNYYKILIYLKLWFSGNQSPVLIWQMGKVGSKTIADSLLQSGYQGAIFHKHALSDNLIFSGEGFKRAKSQGNKSYLYNQVLRDVVLRKDSRWNWKIISLTREPISRNISAFFQNLDIYFPDYNRNDSKYNSQEIIRVFFQDFTHNRVLDWFDNEIKALLDLDIYAIPFDKERGYQVYSSDNFSVLVIKMEKITDVASEAMCQYLKIDHINLSDSNKSDDKFYSKIYREVKDNILIPEDYLTTMYESKYCKHFYLNKEIKVFRDKW
ncbi:MAG: putative capsular polysaccharide synthesis family protein [Methylococcaceae bacterium]